MKKLNKPFHRIRTDGLIGGSLILLTTINLFNFLNYLFHFFMARMLGPADYGILAVLMSFVYVFSIPSETIQIISSRYTSTYMAENNLKKIKGLLCQFLKRAFHISLILFIIYLPIAFLISPILDIDVRLIILTGVLLFGAFIFPIPRGVLQGKLKLKEMGWNMVAESSLKLLFAIVLVYLGLKVFGAVLAIISAFLIAFVLIFVHMRDILAEEAQPIGHDKEAIHSYGFPVLAIMTSIVFLYSLDIILAKASFPPEIAGKYAVASMFGKMIFFGTMGIGKAMFPLASERHEKDREDSGLFSKSLKIIIGLCALALSVYLFFPKPIIEILFGIAYIDVSGILFTIGLAFSFLSIANLLLLNKLVKKEVSKSCYAFGIFVVLQIILLSIFNSSLTTFSLALLVSDFLAFLYVLISK